MSRRHASPVSAVASSGDRKLTTDPKRRPVAATYAAQQSCPAQCPFLGSGCYAESGNVGVHTRRYNGAAQGLGPVAIAHAEADAMASLPTDGRPLRLHVVGDARTAPSARILARASAAWRAKGGGPVWTYSHAWRSVPRDAWGAVSVLASCETDRDVARAHARGYATARVVASFDAPAALALAHQRKGIPCPQQTGRAPDCASCRLCWRDAHLRESETTILFAAHGAMRRVRAVLASRERR